MNDRGSLAILAAGYLALLLTLFLGGFAVVIGLIDQNRIQGVVDSALLYGHDRAAIKGIPDPQKLSDAVIGFLDSAPSAKQIQVISFETRVSGTRSTLWLCAKHLDPIGVFPAGKICKSANAESFLVN